MFPLQAPSSSMTPPQSAPSSPPPPTQSREPPSLKWSGHYERFIEMTSLFRVDDFLTDMALQASDGLLRAHRVVMAAYSEAIGEVLATKTIEALPIINCRAFDSATVRALLDYVYTGEVTVPWASLERLLEAGEILRVHGLDITSVMDANDVDPHFPPMERSKLKTRLRDSYKVYSDGRTFRCNYCNKIFATAGFLAQHITESHSVKALYHCYKCSLPFPQMYRLRIHCEMVHKLPKGYFKILLPHMKMTVSVPTTLPEENE